MGKPRNRRKQKIQTGDGVEENSCAQTEISQPTSGQELALDQNKDSNGETPPQMNILYYDCGHTNSEPITYAVDIMVNSLKYVPVEGDTQQGHIKGHMVFNCAPHVGGSVTVKYYRMVVGSPGTSPTKKLLKTSKPKIHKVEQSKSVKLIKDEIDFPIHSVGLKEQYKVEIKSLGSGSVYKVHQLTLAVIEKVNGEIKIRVTDQIIWLNNIPYLWHNNAGIFKALNMVNTKCGRCLKLDNPGVLEPIGDIIVTSEIGRGSNTIVFNGTFQDWNCAVKRHPVTNRDGAYNDIKMMKGIGSHSNIVSYSGKAEHAKYVFVAMEMCKSSLNKLIASRLFENGEYKLTLKGFEDLVLWKRKKDPRSTEPPPNDICIVYPSEHLMKILRGIVSGLSWLHSRNISHNNLKIQNVLINRDTTVVDTDVVDITAKLSNFSRSTIGSSSSGGQEPTFDGDLDDLGNLILECITIVHDGKTMNKKTKKINWVTHLPEAHDLITQLQNRDPKQKLRPTAAQAYNHPFFLGPKELLDFLYYASDCVQAENNESKIRKPIFEHQDYKDWDKKIDDEKLLNEIKAEYQSYHGVSLLRVIRNKYGHYRDQTEEFKSVLGKNVTEFYDYFSSRFPNFFMLVYNLFKYNPVKGKNLLDEYLKPGNI